MMKLSSKCKKKCGDQIQKLNSCVKTKCKKKVGRITKNAQGKKGAQLNEFNKCVKNKCVKLRKKLEQSKKKGDIKKMRENTLKYGVCLNKECANELKNMKPLEKSVEDTTKCIMDKCKKETLVVTKCKIDRCDLLKHLPLNLRNRTSKKINNKLANIKPKPKPKPKQKLK